MESLESMWKRFSWKKYKQAYQIHPAMAIDNAVR